MTKITIKTLNLYDKLIRIHTFYITDCGYGTHYVIL